MPDPYYSDDAAFAEMFDLVEPACRGLLARVTVPARGDAQPL